MAEVTPQICNRVHVMRLLRRFRRRADFNRHCDQVLAIVADQPIPYLPVDELSARRARRG